MTHHPHVHGIVPGGGFSADGQQWIACKPGFFLPVRVLSRLFRRLFLEALARAHQRQVQLQFFGTHSRCSPSPRVFADWLQARWRQHRVGGLCQATLCKGPEAVLAYLSRYTHRVAIANSRLLCFG